jgi:Nucleotide modification associated domain 1
MSHGHVNGKCLSKWEEIDCRSPFRTDTGRPATWDERLERDNPFNEHYGQHNDPEFGFDKTAALSDPGPERILYETCRWHGEGMRSPCQMCHPSEKNTLDIRSSLQEEYEVEDIADLDDQMDLIEQFAGSVLNVENLNYLNDLLAQQAKMPLGVTGGGMLDISETHTEPPPFVRPFESQLSQRFEQCEDLLVRKHRDYGPKNISGSPGGPLNGLRVRLFDKLARINNLIDQGNDYEPANESLRDSFMDLANYSVIALMVLDGVWPEA